MGRRFARFWGIAIATMMPVVLIAGGAGAIIGGTDDGDDGHPHSNVGFVIVVDKMDNSLADACTGTLVAPTLVLTAAHCLPDGEYQFAVSFNSEVVSGGGVDNRLIVANGFDRNDEYDVGVLRLAAAATEVYPDITPAALPGEGALDKYQKGALFTYVGYGVDRVRRHGEPVPTEFPRRRLTAPLTRLSARLLHTYNPEGSVCDGDSGGPVFTETGAALVALGNHVNGQCGGRNSGPRLDIEPVLTFLRQQPGLSG